MPANTDLHTALVAKRDEFYTTYEVIEREMNSYVEYDKDVFRDKTILCPCDDPEWSNFTKYFAVNFERLGLKKLISTSYAKGAGNRQVTLFEKNSPNYDIDKHLLNGKIFILESDINQNGRIDDEDITFEYLKGDGDFNSKEVTDMLNESDIIITNPPFSKFRKFLKWILNARKKFIIIGNINAVTFKDVFPYIMNDEIWLGATIHSGDRKFYVPEDYPLEAAGCGVEPNGKRYIQVKGVRWYTNIEHGWRHEVLQLMNMKDNLKYNRKLLNKLNKKFGIKNYPSYDNYAALEVPITEAIPIDYKGVMGVPITFLDKYNPEQFEIIGMTANGAVPDAIKLPWHTVYNNPFIEGKAIYQRILIKHRRA